MQTLKILPSRTVAVTALITLALTGCAGNAMGPFGQSTTTSSRTTQQGITGYGIVEAIELVPRAEAGVNIGSLAGAVVGGLLGNQVGSGRGRTAATILGAAGGAYAGQKIEESRRAGDQVWRLRIRLDNGTVMTVAQEQNLNLRVGDRVRVINGTAQPT